MQCGSKAQVFHGTAKSVCGSGVKKSGLKQTSDGRIVFKRRSQLAKKAGGPLAKWRSAVQKARKKMKIPDNEFILLKKGKGQTKGHKVYRAAKAIYKK